MSTPSKKAKQEDFWKALVDKYETRQKHLFEQEVSARLRVKELEGKMFAKREQFGGSPTVVQGTVSKADHAGDICAPSKTGHNCRCASMLKKGPKKTSFTPPVASSATKGPAGPPACTCGPVCSTMKDCCSEWKNKEVAETKKTQVKECDECYCDD